MTKTLRAAPKSFEMFSQVYRSRIVPAHTSQELSRAFEAHTKDMSRIVEKILRECKITLSNSKTFWKALEQLVPIVHWDPCECAPGGMSLYLLCEVLPSFDLASFFSEMITRRLNPSKPTTILSSKHLNFRFIDSPEKIYFVSEVFILVEDERSFEDIQKRLQVLAQEIALGAISVHHARHILVSKPVSQDHVVSLIQKTIVELSTRKFSVIGPEVFFEMQHFLLATDDEFKKIRPVRHMCRIICCHNWFRKILKAKNESETREILVKLIRTILQFQFGEKPVLGIVITLSHLSKYEQFEASHIASACQRIIPNVSVVPRSFFSYQNPSEPSYSFYLEIENRNGSQITEQELAKIRHGLVMELPHSIEQLTHTLFMPQNEEEIMRNILLLCNEIRFAQDIPQKIITFQGQSDTTLRFHVTLVRVMKDPSLPSVEVLFAKVSELVEFISGSRKIMGMLRKKHPKEANIFVLECRKAPFLRLDHSVDLPRAREFISAAIRQAFGEVRDFNGGLMSQQNQLLLRIKELLNENEKKEEIHLENLFHALQPILMRSLLAPELIKQLFELFVMLHNEKSQGHAPRFREAFQNSALCVMICAEDASFFDELQRQVRKLDFKEQELGFCSIAAGGLTYFGYVVLSSDTTKLVSFQKLLQKTLTLFTKTKKQQPTLRISLQRPPTLLDPRIGTDRTSGIVIKMLYEGLMRISPSGKPTGAIASTVDISDDKKHYVFHLRRTQWTNGKPVTAYDFEYAWKKLLEPTFRAPFAYLFYPVKNARKVKLGLKSVDDIGVMAKDEYTLEVHLEHPTPYFLELTAHWIYSPLCREVDQLHPGWAYYGDDTFVSNGPFRLAKWKRNKEIQVLKNTLYWDAESVQLHQIDISIIEDPHKALSLYQKGDLDWIGEPLSEIPPEAFKVKNFHEKIHQHPIAALHWYELNTKMLPFTSRKCRLALAMALNRKEILDKLFGGTEKAAFSILPPGLSLQEKPSFADGDVVTALRLFNEGLAELGILKSDLRPSVISCVDQEIYKSIAHAASKQWKEALGFETTIETFKWDCFLEKCYHREFQIMGTTWYSWVYDQSYNLEHLADLAHEMNVAQWHHPDYTFYFKQAQESIDLSRRLELMHLAENIVMEELPVIPVFSYTFKFMKKEYLNNIYLSHLGQIDFKWANINPNH